jgi:hypothetical protein
VYKLLPYYQKVFPLDKETSRFIIQKHAFNDEWQLTEIYNYIYRKTIHSFSTDKENYVRDHIIAYTLDILQQKLKEKDKKILNFEEKSFFKKNVGINDIKFAFPHLSPSPLIVPCTCLTPAKTAANELVTAFPVSLCA